MQNVSPDAFFADLETRLCYRRIADEYAGKTARRSGIPYINHIREGCYLLHLLYAPNDAELLDPFCLHPLFQNDARFAALLEDNASGITDFPPRAIALAVEYRRVANAYTLKHAVRAAEQIELSLIPAVHRLLVADKVQNKKDFMKYLYAQHPDRATYRRTADRSVAYFDSWLAALGVSDALYQTLVAHLETEVG